ncbi:related to SOG2 - key component of the RAM signaling network [Ustilago trichophora]|uniref:Related to SOG2 - key component of the RAM signaling network n=1 Tax=Ustilago trichophora TaxID=86804 RepID=A0A5C3E5U5_9BASI|nr:related to SOG2 - key component of the RAM signaling network [Ustilago trichophora]
MHVGQRGARAPIAANPSNSATSTDTTSRGPTPSASAGMAGIGAGRSGAAASYRSYAPHHDYNSASQWSTLDSSHQADLSQGYRGFPSTPSTSSFDAQSRALDSISLPSSSSLYTSQIIQHPAAPSAEGTSASANGSSSTSNPNQRSISEAELLGFVNDKRTKAKTNGSETHHKTSSTSGRDRSNQSKDGGDSAYSIDTLDLCHKRIDRVPNALVDLIRHEVVRLALGYNHITRLPDNFADLHSLRYLNIRANNFAHFPDCVTKMPNLEILDLSRNKIRKLPKEPGRLLALRVLSMNANRLTELPTWVGNMKHLRILKLDNNPLEWPPPHISKMPNVAPPKPPSSSGSSAAAEREKAKRFEDRQMLVWIAKLRSWIMDPANQPRTSAEIAADQPTAIVEQLEEARVQHGAIADFASPTKADVAQLPTEPSDGLMSLQVQVPESVSDRTLRPEADNVALASQAPTESGSSESPAADTGLLPPLIPQPPFHDDESDTLAHPVASGSPQYRQVAVLPVSPSEQMQDVHSEQQPTLDSQSLQAAMSGHLRRPVGIMGSQVTADDADARQHARNNSHSVVQDIAATHQMEGRRSLKSKKSLPDLRKSHEDILQERRDVLAEQLPPARAPQGSVQIHNEMSRDRSQSIASSAAASDAGSSQNYSAVAQPSTRKPLLQTRRMPRPSLGNVVGPSARQGTEGTASGFTNHGGHNTAHLGAGSSQGGGLRKLSLPTVGATQAAAEAAAAALAARAGYSNNTPPRFDVGHGRMASDRADNNWPSRSASPTVNGSRTAADQERNSYFRRLSTLPPSTISKAVPAPVLKFVDGTRGVLFALSQIHAAIGQFMTPVIDERISGQFHRLLDISNGSVGNLINALDRFDSLSRRGTPDPIIIRGVLVTCKDSVITFRKLVSVLQLQLRALQSSSDVRYARTLLLMLYGSMVEVSNSWTEMAPLVEAVQPYLTQADLDASSTASSDAALAAASVATEKATLPSTRAGTLVQKSISNTSSGSTPTLPSIAEASTPVRAGSRPYLARGPSRRRHAGSFSAQDLAQGAAMTPSASNQPPFNLGDLQAASAYSTPARGARSRRQASWGNSASSAATFAQSDSSERSAAADGMQSTAPSTPGGSAATASQRNIYATPGAMSTPTSSRQKRSGSNASSAIETGPLAASTGAMTPCSQVGTPATPAAGTAKQHAPSQSTGAAGGAAATTAAGSRLHMAVSDPKIAVDDHLLEMVDNITKLSARVWSMLFEHLRSAGVDDKPASESEKSHADDTEAPAPQISVEAAERTEHSTGSDSGKEASEGKDVPKPDSTENSAPTQKLNELKQLAQLTDSITSQLRSTYLRAREEERQRPSNPPSPTSGAAAAAAAATAAVLAPDAMISDATSGMDAVTRGVAASPDNITQETASKLFDESHQFVRAIVNTSTLIKTISVSHEFPRELRRMLGQVAQACSNLTVYLLWLSPASVS